jgi:ribonuclease HI
MNRDDTIQYLMSCEKIRALRANFNKLNPKSKAVVLSFEKWLKDSRRLTPSQEKLLDNTIRYNRIAFSFSRAEAEKAIKGKSPSQPRIIKAKKVITPKVVNNVKPVIVSKNKSNLHREPIVEIDPTKAYDYYVYTDGSYNMEKAKGGWAFIVLDKNKKELFRHSEGIINQTSNRAEYLPVINFVLWAQKEHPSVLKSSVLIQSDSLLLVNTYTAWMFNWSVKKKWEKSDGIKNLDLVKELFLIANQFPSLDVRWVRGHNGNEWNEIVDKMANVHSRSVSIDR